MKAKLKNLLLLSVILLLGLSAEAGGDTWKVKAYCYQPSYLSYVWRAGTSAFYDTVYFNNVTDTVHLYYQTTGYPMWPIWVFTIRKDGVLIDSILPSSRFDFDFLESGVYDVHGQSGFELKVRFYINFSGALDVKEPTSQEVTARLNENFQIEFSQLPNLKGATLVLYDILGREIFVENLSSYTGSYVSSHQLMQQGAQMYIWQIMKDGKVIASSKIMKQ